MTNQVNVQDENGLLFAIDREVIDGADLSCDPDALVVFKLGSKDSIPTEEDEQEFINDLKNAETTGRLVTRVPFRTEFVEDFHAAHRGLIIFKLGDKDSGWVPSQDDMESFARLLSLADAAPRAAIIYHWALTIEQIPGYYLRPVHVKREDT